jgi:predicted glutamine amidotransferase
LLDPFIEDLSEENFQRLLNKYKMFDTRLKEKQMNEDMKSMTSSIIETQECILMKEAYEHIYFELGENRIEEELSEKENKEKERISKIKQKWDEVFTMDHKFYFNKRSLEPFRKQKPIILHKFKWTKVDESIKWKNIYKHDGIIIKYPFWKSLFREK